METKYKKQYTQGIFIGVPCNAKCGFCVSMGADKLYGVNKFIPLKLFKEKILNHYNNGVECIIYEGGDFSIYPHIFEILEFGNNLGINQTFQTNGIMLHDLEFVKKLKKFGITELNFSLHAFEEEVSDRIMGVKGGFKKTIKGIKNCVKEGITISMNCVLTNDNIDQIQYVIILAIKLRIHLISFIMFLPPEQKIQLNDFNLINKYIPNPIDIGKNISKALNILDVIEKIVGSKVINVKFHNFPLCLIEKNIKKREYIFDTFRRKYSKYTILDHYKNNECIGCSMDEYCPGITKFYIEKFGEEYIKKVN